MTDLFSRTLLAGALLLGAPTTALAQDEGIPVTIEVRDQASQEVIPTAVVRHPQEAERHRVNVETGRWTESVLYLADGSEVKFEKGAVHKFEVSAPGYKNAEATLMVRKRRNLLQVFLEKMDLSLDAEFEDEPQITFDRDVPLDK
jgi:hypothetical protein